ESFFSQATDSKKRHTARADSHQRDAMSRPQVKNPPDYRGGSRRLTTRYRAFLSTPSEHGRGTLASKNVNSRTTTRRFAAFFRYSRNAKREPKAPVSFQLAQRLAGKGGRVNAGHVFHHAHHLAAVAKLVVIPDVQHDAVVVADGRFGVHHTSVARADEIC